ncbi:DUF4350 domain-containing protein [Sphingorhabdus sp. YGSMI21]|uniref:DUF4350 domain-containing protein n=1 Tax=Sphingorhabdus sp. YGSMI21 TaxID=2077182 RepID=UPI000C1DEB93|nr:DUF4350 domain-containing protein [Sphingorhabdus sp. YGSMI21]ATW03045.1 hypothetical protein CHN51_05450 [Sphingorhabdus sp. YGSMI21]
MSGQANPFQRTTIMVMFAVSFAAFIALLYGLGLGDPLASGKNGDAHGASNSVVGYRALANLLEKTGVPVQYSRSPSGMDDEGLLILTPGPFTPAEEIDAVIQQRAYVGPTMIILPKWQVARSDKLKKGWVLRGDRWGADTGEELLKDLTEVSLGVDEKASPGKPLASAVGARVATPEQAVSMKGEFIRTIVRGPSPGSALVAYLDDGGVYAQLDRLDESHFTDEDEIDASLYPVVIVADADLLNNGGMADKATARHALALVKAASTAADSGVIFDLTFNGLGSAENLLTLAFTPPFLSATICLITAALAAAWMAFNRFGPPIRERRGLDFGKTALVSNSAAFISRMEREYLVTDPYAEMIRAQSAEAVGISPQADEQEIHHTLDELGESDGNRFSALYHQLVRARHPQDIADGAAALHAWKKEFIG